MRDHHALDIRSRHHLITSPLPGNYHAYLRANMPIAMLLPAELWHNEVRKLPWNTTTMRRVGAQLRSRLSLAHTRARDAGLSSDLLRGMKLPGLVIHNVAKQARSPYVGGGFAA